MNTLIQNTVLTEVVRRITATLKVNGPEIINSFESTSCDSILNIPKKYQSQPTDSDLIIFVKMIKENTNYLAYAAPCSVNDYNNRPNIGMISINQSNLDFEKTNLRKLTYTLMHEIYHILGVSPALYEKYAISEELDVFQKVSKDVNGVQKQVFKLTTPKLIEKAKDYFACD